MFAMSLPNIVFMGSPDFARLILEGLADKYPIKGVVTQPDRPAGRGNKLTAPPVKLVALEMGLPLIQPRRLRDEGVFEQLQSWAPDVIIVAAFGQILRQNVLDLPHFGCINVHASLLPRWRGAAPIQAAILAGDAETGVTIMQMDAGIDTGDILSQRSIPISKEATAESLSLELSLLGRDLLLSTLPNIFAATLNPTRQSDEQATYAGMIKKEDRILDLTQPAGVLERKVRAYNPWPGTTIDFEGQPLKILKAAVIPSQHSSGERFLEGRLPAIGTGDRSLLLQVVQPPGKKAMSGKDFLHGAPNWSSK